jgi:hypothetical protein
MSDIPRAKNPYGFELWETWANALGWESSKRKDTAFWLYRNAIHGVRMMVKFTDYINQDDMYVELLRRHAIAKSLGLKTLLVIDWFNRATNRQTYHRNTIFPPDIPKAVRDIVRDFEPDKVEVCNEPYYCKNKSQRVGIAEYRDKVGEYLEGLDRARFLGEVFAHQSGSEFKKYPNESPYDGWEHEHWWPHGMVEGKHSAILHRHATLEQLIQAVGGSWHNGKAVGWKHPIFETELSVNGNVTKDYDIQGFNMNSAFVKWAKSKKLPFAYLIMGGDSGGGEWGMWTRLVDEHGDITQGALGVLDAMGIEYEDPGDDPDDPDDNGDTYPGTVPAYKAVKRMFQLGSVSAVKSDRRVRKYMKRWHKEWEKD